MSLTSLLYLYIVSPYESLNTGTQDSRLSFLCLNPYFQALLDFPISPGGCSVNWFSPDPRILECYICKFAIKILSCLRTVVHVNFII